MLLIYHSTGYIILWKYSNMNFLLFQPFMKIITCFIIYEIKNSTSPTDTDITQISKLWSALKDNFHKNLQLEKYEDILHFLQLTNLLDFHLDQNEISIKLFDTDIAHMQAQFLKSLASSNYQNNKLIFENFTNLISLREADRSEIQNILLLPWLNINTLPSTMSKTHLANAKSLDFATKVKCLNSISRYGKGRHRLDVLNMCISSCEIELGVASVL